jgi:DNA polymerase
VFRKGRDAYIDFAKDVYGIPYEAVTPEQRKIIKPAVLGCGYGLAGGYVLPDGKKTGLLGYAAGMGVMLTPEVAQTHVELWRATYPEVPQTWYDIEKAMHQTIEDRRGRTVNGLLGFRIEGQFLTMELPTERKIWYYKPRVEQRQYISKRTGNPYTQKVMTCMGMVKDKHYWSRIEMRGNLVFENAIQGMCRDIHGNGMILAHDKGFLLVGMVHDELISEEDIGSNYYTSERLRDCVRAETRFPRLKGMPLDASHFSTIRYRKD